MAFWEQLKCIHELDCSKTGCFLKSRPHEPCSPCVTPASSISCSLFSFCWFASILWQMVTRFCWRKFRTVPTTKVLVLCSTIMVLTCETHLCCHLTVFFVCFCFTYVKCGFGGHVCWLRVTYSLFFFFQKQPVCVCNVI